MVSRPLRPCSYPGCSALVKSGKCEQHSKQGQQQYDKQRLNFRQRGYSSNWDKVRLIKLRQDPLCEDCLKVNSVTPAKLVHHDKTVRERPDLTYNMDNLVSLCEACHGKRHSK